MLGHLSQAFEQRGERLARLARVVVLVLPHLPPTHNVNRLMHFFRATDASYCKATDASYCEATDKVTVKRLMLKTVTVKRLIARGSVKRLMRRGTCSSAPVRQLL